MEDQLRLAIKESGMPQNRICRAARMDEGTLSCFMLGKQESMRLKTAQRLGPRVGVGVGTGNRPEDEASGRSGSKTQEKSSQEKSCKEKSCQESSQEKK